MITHRDVQKPHSCTQCSQGFFFGAELEHHKLVFHAKKGSNFGTRDDSNTTREDVLSTRPSSTDDSLLSRAKSADPVEKPTQNRAMTSPPSRYSTRLGSQENITVFKCPFTTCSQVFPSEFLLTNHVKVHYAMTPRPLEDSKTSFPCDQCGANFPSIASLQDHLKNGHNEPEKFPCPDCGRVFSLANNLAIHMKTHKAHKSYSCPICKQSFARKENRNVSFEQFFSEFLN